MKQISSLNLSPLAGLRLVFQQDAWRRLKVEQLIGQCEEKEIEGNEVIVISGYKTKKVPPQVWRECIKKVWEVDPLFCSYCGGLMKIISFIYERKVIKKILDHLGIFQKQEQKRGSPPSPKRCPERVIEPHDDGWPEFEEPAIDVQAL